MKAEEGIGRQQAVIAARDHKIGITPPDRAEGVTNCLGAAGIGGDDIIIFTLDVIQKRDVIEGIVRQRFKEKERMGNRHSLLAELCRIKGLFFFVPRPENRLI